MIAGAVEQRAAGVVRQVAEQQDVVLERLERLQRLRQLARARLRTSGSSAACRCRSARRRTPCAPAPCRRLRLRKRRRHRIEERQRDGGAHARAGTCVAEALWRVMNISVALRCDVFASPRLGTAGSSTISMNQRLEAIAVGRDGPVDARRPCAGRTAPGRGPARRSASSRSEYARTAGNCDSRSARISPGVVNAGRPAACRWRRPGTCRPWSRQRPMAS